MSTMQVPFPPSGPQAYQPPRHELRRSHDRRIAGVCGGIAEHFGVDPTLVRLLFVAGTFVGGGAVVLYLAAWLLMPAADAAVAWEPPAAWRPQPGPWQSPPAGWQPAPPAQSAPGAAQAPVAMPWTPDVGDQTSAASPEQDPAEPGGEGQTTTSPPAGNDVPARRGGDVVGRPGDEMQLPPTGTAGPAAGEMRW